MQVLPQKRSVAPAVLEALGVFHFNPINLKDKVEPVGSLGAHPRGKMASDPCGRRVLRVLQQEVWADWGLAYHRDKLVGKPNLRWRIRTFEKEETKLTHTLFPSTGSNWLKTSSENPWITGLSFVWRRWKMWIVLPVHVWLQLLLHIQFFGVEHQLQLGFPGNALQKWDKFKSPQFFSFSKIY